jgi:hypothetical protein
MRGPWHRPIRDRGRDFLALCLFYRPTSRIVSVCLTRYLGALFLVSGTENRNVETEDKCCKPRQLSDQGEGDYPATVGLVIVSYVVLYVVRSVARSSSKSNQVGRLQSRAALSAQQVGRRQINSVSSKISAASNRCGISALRVRSGGELGAGRRGNKSDTAEEIPHASNINRVSSELPLVAKADVRWKSEAIGEAKKPHNLGRREPA